MDANGRSDGGQPYAKGTSKKLTLLVRILAADPGELEKTCEGCNKDLCFSKSDTITARSQSLPQVEVTRDNWWTVADVLREHFGNKNWGEYAALLEYGICRRSIVTADSFEMVEMFVRCGGVSRLRTPAEYYDLPPTYVDAVAVIEHEKRLIESEKVAPIGSDTDAK